MIFQKIKQKDKSEIQKLDCFRKEKIALQFFAKPRKNYTKQKNKIIQKFYPLLHRNKFLLKLPSRSWSSVQQQTRKLGIYKYNIKNEELRPKFVRPALPSRQVARRALKVLSASVSLRSQMKSYALNLFAPPCRRGRLLGNAK